MKFFSPASIDEAVACLRDTEGDLRVLAGGTDLVVQIRSGRRQPDAVMDIKRIAALSRIARTGDGGWSIGAAVCAASLGEHAQLKSEWPGVVEAVNLIGSMQVQSRATPVGNLCNASPAADSAPALIAAGASVSVIGPRGARTISVEELGVAPGRTCLRRDEFVTTLTLPPRPAHCADAYLRLTPRAEMDIAVVGVGVCLTLDAQGRCVAARLGLGAAAPRPLLVTQAGAALVGTAVDGAALDRMAAAVAAACDPIDDKRGTADYRRRMAPVMARRAALKALERARR